MLLDAPKMEGEEYAKTSPEGLAHCKNQWLYGNMERTLLLASGAGESEG